MATRDQVSALRNQLKKARSRSRSRSGKYRWFSGTLPCESDLFHGDVTTVEVNSRLEFVRHDLLRADYLVGQLESCSQNPPYRRSHLQLLWYSHNCRRKPPDVGKEDSDISTYLGIPSPETSQSFSIAARYVTKTFSRVAGPWESGSRPKILDSSAFQTLPNDINTNLEELSS